MLESYFLGIIFSSDRPKRYLDRKNGKLLTTFRWKRIFSLAHKFVKKKKFTPAEFMEFIPDELRSRFEEIFLTSPQADEPEKVEAEIDKIKKELQKLFIKEKLHMLSLQIAQGEKEGKPTLVKKCETKFSKLTRGLIELEDGK